MKENDCTNKNYLNKTLKVIGGKWKLNILWFLVEKERRFNELTRLVKGITQKMLVKELKEMELDGLVKRKVYPEVPPKVEYSLTTKAKGLMPVIASISQWGEKYYK